ENPKINPAIYSQVIFNKNHLKYTMEEGQNHQLMVREKVITHERRKTDGEEGHAGQLNWIRDLNRDLKL
ncbi:hypothetical protein ACQP3F_34600, partial [Escherichia coli]